MKRVNNLYDEICKLENIIEMTNMVFRNSKNKKKINNFEKYKVEHIINIKNKLENRNYIPGNSNIFMIIDPKIRVIMNQSLEDKIINHLVSYFILNRVFEDTFTDSMIATKKGKEIKYGVDLLKKYLNKLKDNNFYVLKLDIKKYFYNINQEILKNIILHKSKDYLYYTLDEIQEKLKEYNLELNMNKSKINSIKNGIDFVGYKFYIKNNKVIIKPRNRTKKNFMKKIKEVNYLYSLGYIDNKEYKDMIGSFKGYKKNFRSLYVREILQV